MEGGKLKATFRDIYYVSIAKEKSWQQIHRIEERVHLTNKVTSQEEYNEVLRRARKSLEQAGLPN
jgi:hypothetical protein